MIQLTGNSRTLTVALLTVGVDRDLTDRIVQAAAQFSWTVTHEAIDEYISAARRPAMSQETKAADAVLAIIDFDRDARGAMETAGYLNQLFFGRFFAAALSGRSDPDLLLAAMRSGCNEFLRKPIDPRQLADTFDRQEKNWAATMGRARSTGHIISFFGAKGGVGTTMIATTLAYFLVNLHKKRVLLIDNHPEFGHVCLYLG
ncbi:MAG: secretion system protein, partial [Acidobacteriaceae bacterium]